MRPRLGWRLPAALSFAVVVLAGVSAAIGVTGGNVAPVGYIERAPVLAVLPSAAQPRPNVAPDTPELPRAVGAADRPPPSVALIIVGVGLAEAATLAAIDLPPAIGLAFSPYADRAAEWQRLARQAGHEVLVELPVEPLESALADAGPHSLRPSDPAVVQLQALAWAVDRSVEPVGVVAQAGAFASRPTAFAAIAGWLAEHDLGMIELGGSRLADVAEAERVRYVPAIGPIDADLRPEAIDSALAALERTAHDGKAAVGFGRPYPVTLARITAWATALSGVELVPPGRMLTASKTREEP